MSEEALWTVEFETASGWTNGGIVVLETGRVFGGDSGYYYVGKYDFGGPGIGAEVRAFHYHGPGVTAWGDAAQSFNVRLLGAVSADGCYIHGQMTRSGFPAKPRFRMTKRTALP